MPIATSSESLVLLSKASPHVPGRPHTSTLIRWADRGTRGVKLETVLVGGRRFTSLEALERFFAATTAAADGQDPSPRTAARRARDIATAERRLHAAGIK